MNALLCARRQLAMFLRRALHDFVLVTACGVAMNLFCGAPILAQSASPAQIHSLLQQADAALGAGNLPLAEQDYRAVLQLDAQNSSAHTELGVIEYSRGDCSSAVVHLRAALDAAPQLSQARALLGICERRSGSAQAASDLRKAFDALPAGKLRIEVGVELADLDYQRGDIDAALPVVQKLLDFAPENSDILFFAQRLYSEQANSALNKLLIIAPDSARTQQLIAEKLINSGDARDAIDHYRTALALDPHLPGMHFELAEAYMTEGNDAATLNLARQQFEQARDAEGDNVRIECALGSIDQKQGNAAQALAHFQHAYQLAPADPEANLDLGTVLAAQSKPEAALPLLRTAVTGDPMNAAAHYRLARVCHQLHLGEEEAKQIKLYREIHQTQDRVAALYQQMNRHLPVDSSAAAQDQTQ